VSDEKPRSGSGHTPAPGGPPKLERVPPGYTPAPMPRPAEVPLAKPPAAAQRPPPPQATAPGAAYGLAAREVGADAAIAAGIAHEGTLASDGPLRLFALAAALQASGRLGLSPLGTATTYALTFRRGTVEHASSSDPSDDLGRFLVRKGALGEAQLARAVAASAAAGGDLAAALIAEKLVNPADVAGVLQEHGTGIVQHALSVTEGGWSWDPAAQPPPGAFPLGAPFAMLCAALRALDAAAILARLGDREHRVASRVGGRIRLEDLRLNAQESRAAGLFDGVRSPAELASASPGDALVVLRVALLLGEVDLLSFGAVRQRAAPPQSKGKGEPGPSAGRPAPQAAQGSAAGAKPRAAPPSATPAPKPPAATQRPAAVTPAPRPAPAVTPAPAPAKVALDKDSLEALAKKLATANHFEALGVAQTASGAQIKTAYFQLAKAYHPDVVPAHAPPEVKKLCSEVFTRLSEAWSVLGEDGPRATYLEALKSGGTQKVDAMNIFRAETLFDEGVLLTRARRYAEAIPKFEQAIRLNAKEAEFGMWKAFCEFGLAADKRTRFGASAAAIEAGLKKNPKCAQGYLFLGQMAKVAGEIAIAEKHLKRGLAVAPDHADLLRELKYLRK
jgi:DnaJ domain